MGKSLINIPIYEAKIILIQGNYDELNSEMDKLELERLEPYSNARAIWDPNTNRFYIFFRNDLKNSHGEIAHECKHMVNFIFRARGVILDIEEDEHECYFLGYLVDRIYKFLNH